LNKKCPESEFDTIKFPNVKYTEWKRPSINPTRTYTLAYVVRKSPGQKLENELICDNNIVEYDHMLKGLSHEIEMSYKWYKLTSLIRV
jgi:hypothetical protein